MGDLIFLACAGLVFYIAYCYVSKQPLIPSKKNREKAKQKKKDQRNQVNKKLYDEILVEEEAVPFDQFYPDVIDIKDGVIIQSDYWYSMVAKVIPVNYYLLDEDEQAKIDKDFESWLSQLDGALPRIYVQNRFIDLTEDIERIQQTMLEQDDLNEAALQYGKYVLEDLNQFQIERPRFEQKFYLIYDHQVNISDLRIEDGDDVDEKALEKAKVEINRRIATAQSHLSKAQNEVIRLSSAEIIEMLYHLFNRRKARKNRFRDINKHESMSLYSTADQSAEHIAEVKEAIDDVIRKQKEEKAKATRTRGNQSTTGTSEERKEEQEVAATTH
ncbi:hypothetical protein D7X33_18960 [Butyricicoccus sp. 1XD8-22]|nr:hypothetical protein D7X33_18960 [Butyricicoccus sp. 1XD8-22]